MTRTAPPVAKTPPPPPGRVVEAVARDCTAWLPSGRLWSSKADLPSRMRRWAETRTASRVLWAWNIAMTAVVIGLLVTA